MAWAVALSLAPAIMRCAASALVFGLTLGGSKSEGHSEVSKLRRDKQATWKVQVAVRCWYEGDEAIRP